MNEQPKLVFFRTDAGREPVREWLRELDKSDKQRIGTDIEKVQFRWPMGMPLVRKLEPIYGKFGAIFAEGVLHVSCSLWQITR